LFRRMNTKPSKRKSERTRPMMQMMMLSRSANQRTPTHPTGLHHPSRNGDEDGRRKFYSLMILTENKEKKRKSLKLMPIQRNNLAVQLSLNVCRPKTVGTRILDLFK